MDFVWIRLLVVALVALLLVACSKQPAPCTVAPTVMTRLVNVGATEFVFVPAENFSASVEIVAPAEAVTGEWIPLLAKRRSGPWKQVLAVLPPDEPWSLQSHRSLRMKCRGPYFGRLTRRFPPDVAFRSMITLQGRPRRPCSPSPASTKSGR